MPAGAVAVGEKGAVGLQPGRVAEARGLSRLAAVEVSSEAAAAGGPLLSASGGVTPLDALRGRILQPGDTERLDGHTQCVSPIDEEWQRTQCMPRETCVDVAKELSTDPSMFFKPPCVSVHRCSGCCNQEGITCRNTTTVYVNKTVLSVIPFNFVPEPVLIKVANHTECRCMEPAIIRRNAQPHRSSGCSPTSQLSATEDSRRLCASGLIWDCSADRCVPYPSSTPDVERCDCLPRPEPTLQPRPHHRCHLNSSYCDHMNLRFDQASCRCRRPK
ncbi:putative vascular endothelial growth factor D [Scophthalmus maximus]|uniref:Putative vascular endothelial growth factor D n=1 Tax=Scophthalmus maximus TaxID=52904 RepID=A0A2U9BBW7_SCOMX|nr:putative vascular endothelial growth factor D [Scophthalmus maximus]